MPVGDYIRGKDPQSRSTTPSRRVVVNTSRRQAAAEKARVGVPPTRLDGSPAASPDSRIPIRARVSSVGQDQTAILHGLQQPDQPLEVHSPAPDIMGVFDTDVEHVDDTTTVATATSVTYSEDGRPYSPSYDAALVRRAQGRFGTGVRRDTGIADIDRFGVQDGGHDGGDEETRRVYLPSHQYGRSNNASADWGLNHAAHPRVEDLIFRNTDHYFKGKRLSYTDTNGTNTRGAAFARQPFDQGHEGAPFSQQMVVRDRPPNNRIFSHIRDTLGDVVDNTQPYGLQPESINRPSSAPGFPLGFPSSPIPSSLMDFRRTSLTPGPPEPKKVTGESLDPYAHNGAFDHTDMSAADEESSMNHNGNFAKPKISEVAVEPETPTITSKRSPSVDYTPEALYKKPFSEIKAESFDFNPNPPDPVFHPSQATLPLAQKLSMLNTLDDDKRRDFFSSLTISEWEESGDWLMDQFSKKLQTMKDMRHERRRVVDVFEREIERRYEVAEIQGQEISRGLEDMRTGGMEVLKNKKT